MYIVYMAGRPPRQKAKNDARQQLCRRTQASAKERSGLFVTTIFINVFKTIKITVQNRNGGPRGNWIRTSPAGRIFRHCLAPAQGGSKQHICVAYANIIGWNAPLLARQ